MECVIRTAIPEDAAAISHIIVAALRESNARDYSSAVIEQVALSFSPPAIVRFLTQRQMFVATVDDHIVATASLDRDTVRSVFVDPSCQGKGIGRMLMAHIESVARHDGIDLLRVPSSVTAERFYSALGYVKDRDEFHGEERTIVMEKRLG